MKLSHGFCESCKTDMIGVFKKHKGKLMCYKCLYAYEQITEEQINKIHEYIDIIEENISDTINDINNSGELDEI